MAKNTKEQAKNTKKQLKIAKKWPKYHLDHKIIHQLEPLVKPHLEFQKIYLKIQTKWQKMQ